MSLENKQFATPPDRGDHQANKALFDAGFPEFFCKKVERVAAAVFLVTSFLDERDCIKDNLRHSALNLLEASLHLITPPSSTDGTFGSLRSSVEFLLRKILSLLEVSLVNGFISRMNFDVMKSEVHFLLDRIVSADQRKFAPTVRVPSGLFSVSADTELSSNSANAIKDIGIGPLHREGSASSPNVLPVLKDRAGIKDKRVISSVKMLRDEKRMNRRNIIINLIRKNKSITIKDISDVISDCSEKTLQRELVRLVAGSVLKREGKRRWSRYSLL